MTAALLILVAPLISSTEQDANWTLPPMVRSSAGNMRIERLATLELPWGLAVLPDGRLLITEKAGRLRLYSDGSLTQPVQGVPKVVYRGTKEEQGGLLDV